MRVDNIQEVLEYIKQMPFEYNVTSVQGEVVFLKIYIPENKGIEKKQNLHEKILLHEKLNKIEKARELENRLNNDNGGEV